MSDTETVLCFDEFELDAGSGELRRQGDRIKLPPQPFKVLELLARHSGEVLTREKIREEIWRDDTFVDFEQGLNFCIRQIRDALGDTAGAPRFIETLPRRGYRFLLPVEAPVRVEQKTVSRLMVLPFRMLRPRPGDRLSGVQLAGCADHLPHRSQIPGGAVEPGRVAIFEWSARPENHRPRGGRRPDRDRHVAFGGARNPRDHA